MEASQIVGAAGDSGTVTVAVRFTVEAANEPAVNVEAVVERLLRDRYRSGVANRNIEMRKLLDSDRC